MHNLRSALDHLAWQLVESAGGTPSRSTSFPILSSNADFQQQVRAPRKDKRGRERGPLLGISLDHPVLNVIERHQPFNHSPEHSADGAPWDLLTFLHGMWNVDKHQSLHALAFTPPRTASEVFDYFAPRPGVTLLDKRVGEAAVSFSLEDGTEFAHFRTTSPSVPRPHMCTTRKLRTTVMVGYDTRDGEPRAMSVRTFRMVIQRVEAVIADVEPFLR